MLTPAGNSTSVAVPASPFFRPGSRPQVAISRTPNGTATRRRVQATVIKEKKSNLRGAAANLINSIVGSGIVGIPFAIRKTGFGAGVILVLLCAVITEKSLRLLVSTAKHVHCPTYETAMEAAYGTAGFVFITANMFIMSYGALLSYLMVAKDSFSPLFGIDADDAASKRAVLLVVSLGVMVPLSSQRDVASLAWTSRLNVFIDIGIVFLVAILSPVSASVDEIGGWSVIFQDTVHWNSIFVGLGVLSFAFVCQHSAFLIAGSLEQPTMDRWSVVTRGALAVCATLAITCGVSGYVGYLDETRGNILNNLPSDSTWANLARAMLGFTMLFVYPLESFVARHAVIALFFKGRAAHDGDDSTVLNRSDRRILLTLFLYLIAVVPAALKDNVGIVLSVTGSIGGSSLSYIGPGMLFLGIHGERFLDLVDQSWLGTMRRSLDQDTPNVHSPTFQPQETTPLVSGRRPPLSPVPPPPPVDGCHDSFVLQTVKTIFWYISLMPIWCYIAESGHGQLDAHVSEMALRTPYPIRIGDVQYTRVAVARPHGRRADTSISSVTDPNFSVERSPASRPPLSLNEQVGQNLRNRAQDAESEPDPQETPPEWSDFFIAFFYILFGIVALIVGLLSIYYVE